jgi:hypothetical protein
VEELAVSGDVVYVRARGRFPASTSAEWEIAARYIDGVSWNKGSHPAGSKSSTGSDLVRGYAGIRGASGLRKSLGRTIWPLRHERHVWEWCFDGSRYGFGNGVRIRRQRVVRGGCWAGNAYRLQIGGEFGSLPARSSAGRVSASREAGWWTSRRFRETARFLLLQYPVELVDDLRQRVAGRLDGRGFHVDSATRSASIG